MKTNIKYITLFGAIFLLLLSACNQEELWTDIPRADNYLQIEGEIVGAGVITRVVAESPLSISYTGFEDNDSIGFFSFHEPTCDRGSTAADHQNDDDKEYLKNEPLAYSTRTSKFTSTTITNVTLSKLGVTFAYFPYAGDEKMPDNYVKQAEQGQYVPLEANDHYIHIFKDDGRIEDFLTATKRQYADVNYKFDHQFAMLLLFLGEGFEPDTEGNETLTVHLTEKILGAHVTRKWVNNIIIPESFIFTVDKVPVNESSKYSFGHAAFTAPRTDKYVLPESTVERTVYPVIVPAGVEINYIELKDKTGTVQKVKPTKEALPALEGGWKYPLTIEMTGIAPTIYPHEIIPWNEQEEIEVKQLPGIYNTDDFATWLELYNRYAPRGMTGMSKKDSEELERFGEYKDGTEPGTTIGWTFYLRNNVDCSRITINDGTLIKVLDDGVTLDGGNYILTNLMLDFEHKIPADGKVGMIGEIKGGTLRNLRVEFVTVRNQQESIPSGCIAATVSGGLIQNCTVRQAAMMCRGGTAGILAGSMTGGTVSDCKWHGMVQAAQSQVEDIYKGVVGEMSGDNIHFINIINRIILAD